MKSTSEDFKKPILVLGSVFVTLFCLVTVYNSYRVMVLENDVGVLRKLLEECKRPEIMKPTLFVSRRARSVVGNTDDGVPVSSESYAQHKRTNHTHHQKALGSKLSVTALPAEDSYFGRSAPTKKAPISVRTSRVMHFDDKSKAFQQIVQKSSLKSLDSSNLFSNEFTSSESEFPVIHNEGVVRRRNRVRMENLDERSPRTGRIKPLPAIHLSGDTSKYVFGTHENFNGNGHLRHLQRVFVDWTPNQWVEKTGMNAHFSLNQGFLTVKESGIYFIYAQIYYLDEHDRNGYRVFKNDEHILQCTVTSHTNVRVQKGNTCYTAGAEYLSEGDRISLGDLSEGRYSLFEPGKSFFGLVKLGDAKARL